MEIHIEVRSIISLSSTQWKNKSQNQLTIEICHVLNSIMHTGIDMESVYIPICRGLGEDRVVHTHRKNHLVMKKKDIKPLQEVDQTGDDRAK